PGKALVSFDISWFDPVLNRYFLADRNNVAIDVVDPSTNRVIHQFMPGFHGVDPSGNADLNGPDGVLTANNHKELWVGDSPGKMWVLDSTDGTVLKKVPVNPILITNPQTTPPSASKTRADELCYDPKDNLILVASPGEGPSPFVTFISATSYKVVGQIVFDGKPDTGSQPFHGPNATNGLEQCAWSPKTGKFYQNVPEVNGKGDDKTAGAVSVIDPKTMKVEKSFPVDITKCAGNQGMAIGPDNQILLGCNAPSVPSGIRNSVIINQHTGAIIATLKDEGGADEVWFNPNDGHYFIAAGSHLPNEQLGVVDAKGHRLDQTVVTGNAGGTARRAHSVAANSHTNEVYLPVPATGGGSGGSPGFTSTLCGATPALQQAGCIAVFATKNDDRSREA